MDWDLNYLSKSLIYNLLNPKNAFEIMQMLRKNLILYNPLNPPLSRGIKGVVICLCCLRFAPFGFNRTQ